MGDTLTNVIIRGDLSTIIKIIENNTFDIINEITEILKIACIHGHLNIIEYISNHERHKQNIHICNDTLFYWASKKGHLEIIKYLIRYCEIHCIKIEKHIFESMFCNSCNRNWIDIVKYLIKYCERINCKIDIHIDGDSAFIQSCECEYQNIIEYLIYLKNHNYGNYTYQIEDYKQLYIQKYSNNNDSKQIHIYNNNITNYIDRFYKSRFNVNFICYSFYFV